MIIDASVAFKWVFPEPGTEAASRLIGRDDLRAPTLMMTELGNAFWKKGMKGELGDQESYSAQLALVASLAEMIDEAAFIPRALEMALVLRHAIYDCVYLAVAEATDDVFVTADGKFVAKVQQSPFALQIKVLA